jgi:hypothetical protein
MVTTEPAPREWQAHVPLAVLAAPLSAATVVVYAGLVRRMGQARTVIVHTAQIAADTVLSQRTVRDALTRLATAGHLVRQAGQWLIPRRRGRHARVWPDLLRDDRLTPAQKRLQMLLVAHAPDVHPSRPTLARLARCSESQVTRNLAVLERHGWQIPVTKPRSGSGLAVQRVVFHRHVDNPQRRPMRPQSAADAPDSGGWCAPNSPENSPVNTKNKNTGPDGPGTERTVASRKITPVDPTLPGMDIEPEPPKLTAGLLVQAWVAAYRESQGREPHPYDVKRAAGTCRNVAKTCTDVEHWRDAWRAARTAGRRAKFDISAFLVSDEPAPLYVVPRPKAPIDLLAEELAKTGGSLSPLDPKELFR